MIGNRTGNVRATEVRVVIDDTMVALALEDLYANGVSILAPQAARAIEMNRKAPQFVWK
jgi:hypothetical protein